LFIDTENPFQLDSQVDSTSLECEQGAVDPQTGTLVELFSRTRFEHDRQRYQVAWRFEEALAGAGQTEPGARSIVGVEGSRRVTEVTFTYHYLYPHELDLALAERGFRVLSLYGDYDRSPYTAASARLLFLAEKV
jgi:hypothetical protein